MQLNQTVTVADLAATSLAAVKVFERLGIDYCCGGKRPLAEICLQKGLDAGWVQSELDAAANARDATGVDWNTAPLQDLIAHIVNTHHDFLRREFPPLADRLAKVYRVYNERYGPALTGLPDVFADLRAELEMHMRKEEMILFPAIAGAEQAANAGAPAPRSTFGTMNNPIQMMEAEHESAGQALAKIRVITQDFAVPDYACVTYRALMSGLAELEQDLHLHIHLENNVLFPRALELERTRP